MKDIREDLEMLKLKAVEAKRQAAIARKAANLAAEYAVDCQLIAIRTLERLAHLQGLQERQP